jgi:Cu-Zn family superoxide dismutase
VLSTSDGATIRVLDSQPGTSPTFVNDVALAPGYAYFTDTLRPVILRASRSADEIGGMQPWLDLTGTPFAFREGFNANGIVSLAGGRLLVVAQSNTGKLFRIDTRRRSVSEIDLHGVSVTNGDGLVARGDRLYVMRNADDEIVELKLLDDRRSATLVRRIHSDALMFPTTAALDRERLLVVNAQFDKRTAGTPPVLPFTVAAVPLP